MMDFLLFVYIVSALVYFGLYMFLNISMTRLYKKYDIAREKHGFFYKLFGLILYVLISLVPGFRLGFLVLALIAYGNVKEELE